MVLATKKATRGRGRRNDAPARTPTPGRRQPSPVNPVYEVVIQNVLRKNLRDRARRPVAMPSSDSSTSPSSGQSTPSDSPGPRIEETPAVVEGAQRIASPELPSPNLNGLITNGTMPPAESVSQRIQELNRQLDDTDGRLQDSERQMAGISAVIREQTDSIASLADALPKLQITMADLKPTICHEATSRIRAAEQSTATTLQTHGHNLENAPPRNKRRNQQPRARTQGHNK